MSYKARVFRVFIASPSDVLLEREITRNVLEQWNSINSEREKIVLVPIGWETNAAPEMGRPAQDYINMDILDTCDVVIGIFWTRAGTPTRNAASGSIEEILRESPKRRITMLYFSNKPIPPSRVDTDQTLELIKFKNKVKKLSYYDVFEDEKDLESKLYRHIQVKVNEGKFRPMCDALIFLARIGACNNLVFRNGCVELAQKSQPDFCTFLDDLKSINRYEFEKLYNSELLQDDEFKKYLKRIIKRDQKVEQEDD